MGGQGPQAADQPVVGVTFAVPAVPGGEQRVGGGVRQAGGIGSQGSQVGSGLTVRGVERGGRDRSPSIKRKMEDGSAVNVDRSDRPDNRAAQWRSCVVGTANNTEQVNRKMRSPPADIFVWGIHPDTSIPDIVADLGDSGIIVQERDVEKKSKAEAFLVSYGIRLKAEDLEKALDPRVWPMRVKVREYIHYSTKPRQQRAGARGQEQADGTGGQDLHRPAPNGQAVGSVGQGGSQGERDKLPVPLATNRFSALSDNVSGDNPAV